LAGLVLALGLAVVLVYPIELDYIAFSPGSVEDVSDHMSIEGDISEPVGDLFFLTVSTDSVNVFEYIEATFDGEIDLTRRSRVRRDGETNEEFTRRNLASMEESKRAATYVALTSLGYEPSGSGALITDLVSDSPAIGLLEIGDIVVAVAGTEVTLADEAVDIVGTFGPGQDVTLTVMHGEDGETEDIEVTLGTNPDDASRGLIGVFLTTAIDFPVDVDIDSGNIGGPSAGLMYALGIMNLLTPEDMTQGHLIAGTGTIRFDGSVGPIGGVRQKIFAAIDAGASYALVPADNYTQALGAADGDIDVISMANIDDALEFFSSLEPSAALQASQG
ncbi:MAG: PDZ domain-containing protein, partial [Acidimicrobiia bacterium]|nr:PDZ domain-containing protein [Acidimicrobiia bacterium]